MMPSGPSVQITALYAQSVRDTSAGKNRNESKMANPANPKYHVTGGDNNLAKTFVRHGPDAYYMHIMKAAFDPVYGRNNSIADHGFERPQTRFPLIESEREHERSENNNSPQKVYRISFHQEFNADSGKNKSDDKKSKDKNYQPYNSAYKANYKSDDNIITYGQKDTKKDKKSPYASKMLSEAVKEKILDYFKKDYKAEFPDDGKESLYMKSLRVLSGIYKASKGNKYAKANGYSHAEAANYSESDSAYTILPGAVYGTPVIYAGIAAVRKPANDNELEQRLVIKPISAQGGLEGKIAA